MTWCQPAGPVHNSLFNVPLNELNRIFKSKFDHPGDNDKDPEVPSVSDMDNSPVHAVRLLHSLRWAVHWLPNRRGSQTNAGAFREPEQPGSDPCQDQWIVTVQVHSRFRSRTDPPDTKRDLYPLGDPL